MDGWNEPGSDDDFRKFHAIMCEISVNAKSRECPLCNDVPLRFYMHQLSQGRAVGTIWVWCPRCRVWSHLRVPMSLKTTGPFSGKTLTEMSSVMTSKWISELDILWETKRIGEK